MEVGQDSAVGIATRYGLEGAGDRIGKEMDRGLRTTSERDVWHTHYRAYERGFNLGILNRIHIRCLPLETFLHWPWYVNQTLFSWDSWRKDFGEGKWNGFGGKVEKDVRVCEGAVRELEEQRGLVAKCLIKIGILEFQFAGDPVLVAVQVCDATHYEGDPAETEERQPQWFPENGIRYDQMWPDDILWYPL